MTERVPFTLGTMDDIGLVGLPIELACSLMNTYANYVSNICNSCNKEMQALICSGGKCNHPRHVLDVVNRFKEAWGICDNCYDAMRKDERKSNK